MKIGGKNLELVTDFASLRPGAIVYDKQCTTTGCGKEWCRAMVFKWHPIDESWALLPNCSTVSESVVSRYMVAQGRVYREVNPLDAATTARKREAVRT